MDTREYNRQLKEVATALKNLGEAFHGQRTPEEQAIWDTNIAKYESVTGKTLVRQHDGSVKMPFETV